MDKILLSSEDVEYILKWRDDNKDLVRNGVIPMSSVRFEFPEVFTSFTAVEKGGIIKLCINRKGNSLGNISFEHLNNGMCKVIKDKTKGLSNEDKKSILTIYCSTMALLVYGGSENEYRSGKRTNAEKITVKKVQGSIKKAPKAVTYILNRTEKTAHLAVRGSHKSPEMSFGVRGHFRHYKSGKVVWINEFVKGAGNKRDKTYKLGGSI